MTKNYEKQGRGVTRNTQVLYQFWYTMKKMTCIRPKKLLTCFSGHIFKETDATGQLFILNFIQQKTDAGTFFLKFKRFFGYYSSQAIKLDSESLCTLSRFDFITYAKNLHCWGSITNKTQ